MRIGKVIVWGLLFGILAWECSSLAVESEQNVENTNGLRNATDAADSGRKLSRKRRFIAFPLGSSFSVAVCMTIGVLGNPNYQYLSLGLNWGVAYNLPNSTWILEHAHGFGKEETPEPVVKRRYRRDLYHRLELLMENMGYNGRECILRALCESSTFFQSEKLGMVPELVRTIFSLPKTRLYAREIRENADIEHYNRAYFSGEDEDCEMKYPCSFSLLELAMGRYSDPPEYYDEQ